MLTIITILCVQKYSYWYIKLRVYIYTETYAYVSTSKIILIPNVSNVPKKNTQKYVQTLFKATLLYRAFRKVRAVLHRMRVRVFIQ